MKKFFYVPLDLDIKCLLSVNCLDDLNRDCYIDKFHYVIDFIYLRNLFKDRNRLNFVNINSDVLQRILGSKFSTTVKRELVSLGVLDVNCGLNGMELYSKGNFSKRYRFSERYRDSKFTKRTVLDGKFTKKLRICEDIRSSSIARLSPGHKLIRESLTKLTFDIAAARRFLDGQVYDSEAKAEKRAVFIGSVESNDFSFASDDAGRLYHFFCLCPRDLRGFFKYKDESLYSIDISNCQPALHSILYEGDCPEKRRYIDLVQKNLFYNFLNDGLGSKLDLSKTHEKQALKKEVFHKVFYGPPYSESEMNSVFKSHFPTLNRLIKLNKPKLGNYYDLTRLPKKFQKIESDTVIRKAASRLAKAHRRDDFCLVSVHDSLVTTKSFVGETKEVLINEFKNILGFEVNVGVEKVSHG